jgi:hypothetical protein
MRFFYVNAENQAIGPVDAAALEALKRQGAIGDDTRIAREGESVWRAYIDVFSGAPGAAAPDEPARPMAVKVFGICNIVFGAMGFICLPLLMVFTLAGAAGVHGNSPFYSGWLVFLSVFSIFLSGALVVSGIGLLRFRPWGLTLALLYCVAEMVLALSHAGVSWTFRDVVNPDSALALKIVQVAVELFFNMIYPVVMFILLRLPVNRDAFRTRD